MSNYVGLHIHSESSFLDGYARVDQIAARAAELGQQAVALTDHGEVNGHLMFQKACLAKDIKPIFGMEGYWSANIQASRDAKTKGLDNSHIVLLAKNQKGLQNLWAWSSKAYEEKNFYLKPQADLGLMREYAEGLYASDGCMFTEFARAVNRDDEQRAREILGMLLNIFGESFFMELHTWQFLDPQSPDDQNLNAAMTKLNQAKVRMAKEMGIPLVVVNDAHYAYPQDWENHSLVWQFNTRYSPDQPSGQAAAWMMEDEELALYMAKHGIARSVTEEAIRNSFDIAEQCNVEIAPTLDMPRLNASEPDDRAMFLDLLEKGFQEKVVDGGLDQHIYCERLEEEAKLIIDRNFTGYFNIVADYVQAAKSGRWKQYVSPGSAREPLLVGPGRGSAGGSVVAWLLGITTVDPIKYGLLFSRFISPGRKGLPDIDVDVPQSRRPEMKDYFAVRYGHDHVCGIGTRSRSQARGTLADLCRVLNIAYADRKRMSDILDEVEEIEEDSPDSWDHILAAKGGDLAVWAQNYPKLFEKMGEMVGLARHSGTHAAGILVSAKPILGKLPTRVKNGQTMTQFDMGEVEWLGGVKLDLLGLRHLDTLTVARQMVYGRHQVFLDYYAFGDKEMRDPDIWEQIDKGQAIGIFQLETANGTKVAQEYQPRSEEDVAVVRRKGTYVVRGHYNPHFR